MTAAVHLGQNYQENLRTTKNTDFEKVKHLFDISQELILNQKDDIWEFLRSNGKQFHG